MSALVFMDTETTGLSLDDDIWEFAAIRREADGTETEHHMFIQHDPRKCQQLPASFLSDHMARFPSSHVDRWAKDALPQYEVAIQIEALFQDRPHVVGAVPNFDTERIARLCTANGGKVPNWHYHLIDVENLAVGWLAAQNVTAELPWNSDYLSRVCGVESPTTERHTAMGDVRWAMALYDAITSGEPA